MKTGILILSDRAARGDRVDRVLPLLREELPRHGFEIADARLLSDDYEGIEAALIDMADNGGLDVIFTSGGTGLSPRDNTPEATEAVATRRVPGIAEAMRAESAKYTDRAMLSRGVCVIRNRTLIINLPGSPKAVAEILQAIVSPVFHGLQILRGDAGDCAGSSSFVAVRGES